MRFIISRQGMYEGPFRGAEKIAERWCAAVEKSGSYWTIDALLIDADKAEAVIEWTHFKTEQGTVLRGAEWVVFDKASGLMREIRAYYASPQAANLKRLEPGRLRLPGARLRAGFSQGKGLMQAGATFHSVFPVSSVVRVVWGSASKSITCLWLLTIL